ncbi:Cupin domain-containing protein [Bryocella elongata]|uniref:Cupin domain-containing protein n=1 Tax=Bryocella elongata TaxID=863522 RepID=A0A1H5T4S6_9BACT|nr:cupin domain-containing protein [Bryocella elongata]SEF57796.1 Cupin domain-containing protein [Bryocella elongata]
MSEPKQTAITVVRPEDLSTSTAQTAGSQRWAAFDAATGVSGLWAGSFEVQPGASTGIHHHGEQETVVYVLEGEALVRWGERGEHHATVRAGDFLHVPSWLIHQEVNPSPTLPFRWIVVRSSAMPVVVDLPDSQWPIVHPE